jgi:hypothetical protein
MSPRPFTCQGCGMTGIQDSQGRARKWCSHKCRCNTKYGGTCIDCGAPTNGKNGIGKAPHRCQTCSTRRQQENARWTRETIVAAIQTWTQVHGTPPSARGWRTANGRPVPASSTVQAVFGSWSAALEAAGFSGPRIRYPGDDPAVVAETIRLYRDEGLSAQAVGDRLGVTDAAVIGRLKSAGVPRRAVWETRRLVA